MEYYLTNGIFFSILVFYTSIELFVYGLYYICLGEFE